MAVTRTPFGRPDGVIPLPAVCRLEEGQTGPGERREVEPLSSCIALFTRDVERYGSRVYLTIEQRGAVTYRLVNGAGSVNAVLGGIFVD